MYVFIPFVVIIIPTISGFLSKFIKLVIPMQLSKLISRFLSFQMTHCTLYLYV